MVATMCGWRVALTFPCVFVCSGESAPQAASSPSSSSTLYSAAASVVSSSGCIAGGTGTASAPHDRLNFEGHPR